MLPSYQDCMLPTLTFLKDGGIHSTNEINAYLIKFFRITEQEQAELLPSKGTTRFFCNSSWARTYMKAAKLISSPKRGMFVLTQAGEQLLATNPSRVDRKLLEQYETFVQWSTSVENKRNDGNDLSNNTLTESINPEEQISEAYNLLRNILAQELLDKILERSPRFFETLVARLLVAMGYGGSFNEISEIVVGKAGDEGIDGIIKEDRLGLDNIYVQAKCWGKEQVIGRPEVQKFVGALSGQGANKGIFITTARFSEQAKSFKPHNNIKVALIDGTSLCQHLIDYNIGVSTQEIFEVKRIDLDFFSEE